MKVLLVCALFALAIAEPLPGIPSEIVEAWKKLLEPHRKSCMEESAVEEDKANAFGHEHFADDRPFKCYLHCLNLKLNFMDSNGDFIIEELRKHVPDAIDLKSIHQMLNEEKELCEKSYLLFMEVAKAVIAHSKNTV